MTQRLLGFFCVLFLGWSFEPANSVGLLAFPAVTETATLDVDHTPIRRTFKKGEDKKIEMKFYPYVTVFANEREDHV